MRILHLFHNFHPIRGGIEDHIFNLARAQTGLGHEDAVLTAAHSHRASHQDMDGVTVIRAATRGRLLSPFCPGWPDHLRRHQADIVHLHLPCPLGEWSVWLARPRRLVVYLHNDYVRPAWALPLHRPMHQAVLALADVIVTSTWEYARTSPALAPHQHKLEVVPLGIDTAPYLRLGQEIEPAREGVASAGRLCYYKGLDVLLDAAPSLDARLTIVGDGPWRRRLGRRARSAGLAEDRVRFTGYVAEPGLIELLHAHAVFVFPSTARSEAYGLMQLKAMLCGLPVVSSDLPGVGWLNRDGETGFVVPARDPAALADATNRLLRDEALRRRVSAAARAHAGQFTHARMLAAIERLYHRVMAADGNGQRQN